MKMLKEENGKLPHKARAMGKIIQFSCIIGVAEESRLL
jgi:hypothetical protein